MASPKAGIYLSTHDGEEGIKFRYAASYQARTFADNHGLTKINEIHGPRRKKAPKGCEIGHLVSVTDAYVLGFTAKQIAHPYNLCWQDAKSNRGDKTSNMAILQFLKALYNWDKSMVRFPDEARKRGLT